MNKHMEIVSRVTSDCVAFTWKIENFSSLLRRTGEFVRSSVVKCSDTQFCLMLYPFGKNKPNHFDVILEKAEYPPLLPVGEYDVGIKDRFGCKRVSFSNLYEIYTSDKSNVKSSAVPYSDCNTIATTNAFSTNTVTTTSAPISLPSVLPTTTSNVAAKTSLDSYDRIFDACFFLPNTSKSSIVKTEKCTKPVRAKRNSWSRRTASSSGITSGNHSVQSVAPVSENISAKSPCLCSSEKTPTSFSHPFLETDRGISLPRDLLLNFKEDLLPDDVLTVLCEIKLTKTQHVSESTGVHEDTRSRTGITKLLKGIQCAFENPQFSDVTLKVRDVEFPAHKIILANRSKVFDLMFQSGMKESQENVVNLVEMKPATAKEMLRYIYTGKVQDLSMDKAADLYAVADRYDMPELKKWCKDFLLQHISPDFVCDVAVLADLHGDEDLKNASKRTIRNNLKTVLNSENWAALSKENPAVYLEMLQLASLDDSL